MKKTVRKKSMKYKITLPFFIATIFLIHSSLSITSFASDDYSLDDDFILKATINDAFENIVRENPHVLASIDYKEKNTITYQELRDSSLRLANALQQKIGLEKGDLVFTLADNSIHHSVIFHSNMYGGFINANVNKILSEEQIAQMINKFECKVLFYHYRFHSFVTENHAAGRFGNKVKAFIRFGEQPDSNVYTEAHRINERLDTSPARAELTPKIKTASSDMMLADNKADITINMSYQDQPFFSYEKLIAEFEPQSVPVELGKNDLAILLFTSGTTGLPKAIEVTHGVICDLSMKKLVPLFTKLNTFAINANNDKKMANLDKQVKTTKDANLYYNGSKTQDLTGQITHPNFTKPYETIVNPQYIYMSFSWVVANIFKLMNSFTPITLVVTPEYDRKQMLEMIPQFKFTTIFFSPSMVNDLVNVNTEKDVEVIKQNVRVLLYSGGSFPATLITKMIEKYQTESMIMQQFYSSTETLIYGTKLGPEMHNLNNKKYFITVGKPEPGVEVKIVDKELKEIATGESGKILIKAPIRTSGYYKNTKSTRELFPLGDEWIDTGDYGHLDQEGYLIFNARNNERIITPQGLNVSPKELEDLLIELSPLIQNALVAGCKDPQISNYQAQGKDNVIPSICAFVQVDKSIAEDMGLDNASLKIKIRESLLDRLKGSDWKVPATHNILIMKKLPINHNNHKFIKTPLVEAYESGKDLENITEW